jgi:hypothetical protein
VLFLVGHIQLAEMRKVENGFTSSCFCILSVNKTGTGYFCEKLLPVGGPVCSDTGEVSDVQPF